MLNSLVQAARDSKRSVLSLIVEAIRLRYSGGQVGISEFIDFRLYLDDLTFAEKTTFGGWRAQVILEEILEDENSLFLSIDKVTMYSLLRAYGFPIPEFRAVYRSQRPRTILNITSGKLLAGREESASLSKTFERFIWSRQHPNPAPGPGNAYAREWIISCL